MVSIDRCPASICTSRKLAHTLAATAKRSPLDRTILAHALANIDKMGAKSIGIDILIDQPQPEDSVLLAAMKAMKTPVWLAYGSNATNSSNIETWQQDFMDEWHRKLAGSNIHKTSIRGEADQEYIVGVAGYVDRKMREITEKLPVASLSKVVILASLNIADELFKERASRERDGDSLTDRTSRLHAVIDRLDQVLSESP